jgi:transcriptional regulator with XRE-family HTH domain
MVFAMVLREARQSKGLTQAAAAARLGLSQPYLAMLERGQRRLTPAVARRAMRLYDLSPAVLPPVTPRAGPHSTPATLAHDLALLGYPGFAHLRPRGGARRNPAEVLLEALGHDDLEARLVEALPWLVLRYSPLDHGWLVPNAKVRDLQNRLGFVVTLARQVAERQADGERAGTLQELERGLEPSRLAREDTLCRASMPPVERRWLAEHASKSARHWNLVTDWRADALRYSD